MQGSGQVQRFKEQDTLGSSTRIVAQFIVFLTMEYYSAIRKEEILSFATIWMNLEGIMLSNKTDRERLILPGITYVESEKKKDKFIKQSRKVVVRGVEKIGRGW